MNRPKAKRLGLFLTLALVAALTAFVPSSFAAISTEASTVYGSTVPGAHTDYTIIQKFQYDDNGVEPQATDGAGQDLKKWIVDSPAGLVGNPNAIPYENRCEPSSFDPTPSPYAALNTFWIGSCPDSAQVGSAEVYLVNDADSGTCPAAPITCLSGGFGMYNLPSGTMKGKIYLLKTEPEIPFTLVTIFQSATYQNYDYTVLPGAGPNATKCTTAPATPCPIQPKTKSILAPVTNRSGNYDEVNDFRIRTIPAEDSAPPRAILPTAMGHAAFVGPANPSNPGGTPLHISRIDQKLFGMVDPENNFANAGEGDTPFLSMPSRCGDWDSYSYAVAWNGGGGDKQMDPNHPSENTYVQSNKDTAVADCSGAKPTLKATGTAAFQGTARSSNVGLTVTIADPTASEDDQPAKVVATLPSSVTNDTSSQSNLCTIAERDSEDGCPETALVGTASIKTPLLSGGLTGKVYKTQRPAEDASNLPNLSIFVDGAVKFRLDATTKFVGQDFDQIETTFDNMPQTPFTEFKVTINGGQNSLLKTRECPTDGNAKDTPVKIGINGYLGETTNTESGVAFDACPQPAKYGVKNPTKVKRCVRVGKSLSVRPSGIVNSANVSNVQLLIGKKSKSVKKAATDKKSPFSFKKKLSKKSFKKKKTYYYSYRVAYKDGKVLKTKTSTFKTCK